MMQLGNAAWGLRETPLERQAELTASMGLELLELSIMQKVCARIANLGDDQALAFQDGSGAGCAHASAAASVFGGCDDFQVRRFYRASQGLGIRRFGSLVCQDGGRDLRGDFACGVTAHAVRHSEQRGRDDQTVLIVVAHAADVGAASEFGESTTAGARRRAIRMLAIGHYARLTRMETSPIVTTSLLFSAVGAEM